MYGVLVIWFLLIILLGYAQFDRRIPQESRKINVYWNIPTFQCAPHKINFTILADKYGILQNTGDSFQGDKIAILYNPGNFPVILQNIKTQIIRNGGVPQAGNLTEHLEAFEESLDKLLPDENFSGIGIIDFENWRPIFRQNFGTLSMYKDYSIALERNVHPSWTNSSLEKAAKENFEYHARKFFEETLLEAKRLRPNGTWGYYAYPYCFNMSPNHMKRKCPVEVIKENDREKWLFSISDNLYPSLYLWTLNLNATNKVQMIEGRLDEALRITNNINKSTALSIMPYFWYKYHDVNEFISKEDLFTSFTVMSSYKIDGVIIWGSSNDVNTRDKCMQLYKYIDEVLGPLVIHIFD